MDDEQTNMPIGQRLKDARIRRRLSLDEVSGALHVRRDYLQALEQDDWERLPGEVYGQGFLRSYGRYLGLDGDKLVQLRRAQLGLTPTPAPSPPTPSGQADRRPVTVSRRRPRPARSVRTAQAGGPSPATLWVVVALVALFIGGAVLMSRQSGHRVAGSVPPSMSRSPASSAASRSVRSQAPTSAPVRITLIANNPSTGHASYRVNRSPVTVALTFSAPCWVEVWQNGVTANPYGHIYQPGQVLTVTGQHSVAIRLGNRHVRLTVNHQAFTLPDSADTVLQLTFNAS